MSETRASDDPIEGTIITPEFEYAYFYPEGTGYLWVKRLGSGSEGVTDIVWSCEEQLRENRMRECLVEEGAANILLEEHINKYFVRKTAPLAAPHFDRNRLPNAEVANYRKHPRIPELKSWHQYHRPSSTDVHHNQSVLVSMIFQYCNGGTLNDLRLKYLQHRHEHRQINGDIQHFGEVYVPEAFVWKVFGQVLETVDWLRHQRPAINHNDIHSENIFLHFSEPDQVLPDCFVGDFGMSRILYSDSWDVDGLPAFVAAANGPNDFIHILDLVKELMTLTFPDNYNEVYTRMVHGRVHYSPLLYAKVQWLEELIPLLQANASNPSFSTIAQQMIAYGNSYGALCPVSLKNVNR